MKKGTKSLNVSAATHKRVAMLARQEDALISDWVERALVAAAEREERRRERKRQAVAQ